MKSVVAEASSIAKAIELAWQKAGQPKEFLIKVFQEPQRNIFGLTKTSAKVGIFFDDASLVQKIKTATQNTVPVANHNLQKPINSTSSNKQISPIKPLNSKNAKPQVQAQKQPKPAVKPQPIITNQAPVVTPILTPPAIEPVVAQVNAENSLPVQTEQPRAASRKKYYRRRKPRTPRPNDTHNNTAPAKINDKNDN